MLIHLVELLELALEVELLRGGHARRPVTVCLTRWAALGTNVEQRFSRAHHRLLIGTAIGSTAQIRPGFQSSMQDTRTTNDMAPKETPTRPEGRTRAQLGHEQAAKNTPMTHMDTSIEGTSIFEIKRGVLAIRFP